MQIYIKYEPIANFPNIVANVRRYVALVRQLADGGACFCTRGAMHDYDVVLFILALAKTVTPGGSPRREPGQAAAPTTKPSSLVTQLSRHGKPMTYTDLLPAGLITSSLHLTRILPGVKYISY